MRSRANPPHWIRSRPFQRFYTVPTHQLPGQTAMVAVEIPKQMQQTQQQKPPQPLGLPSGSVRAVIALILCGTLWFQVLKGEAIEDILVESALLVVGFYFGVRSGTGPPIAPATAEGMRHPLFLPRGSIRFVLLLGFFGVIAYMWYRSRGIPEAFTLILEVLASYVIGYIASAIIARRQKAGKKPSRALAVFRNANAIAAMLLVGYLCGALLFSWPRFFPEYTKNALAWIVAYYFGSRLAA